MAKNRDITIESSLPVVSASGLNTNKAVDFSGAPSVNLPVNTVVAGSGTLVDTSSAQTLTNKTFANPTTITGAVISGATIGTSTLNGVTLTTGGSTTSFLNANGVYSTPAGGGGITIGTTSITGGTTGRVLYDNAGVVGELSVTGSGNNVLSTSPTLVTPILGVATAAAVIYTNNAILATSNAATVPVTSQLSSVTNNSAATLTITITTTSAVDGQLLMVRIFDATGVAQTITWINTESSSVTVPITTNGSTTLFLTVGFIYNSATNKWRCIAVA